jgi:hypothetical protein
MLRSHCQPCGDQTVLCHAASPYRLVLPNQAIKDPGQLLLIVWLRVAGNSRFPNSSQAEQKVALCTTNEIDHLLLKLVGRSRYCYILMVLTNARASLAHLAMQKNL